MAQMTNDLSKSIHYKIQFLDEKQANFSITYFKSTTDGSGYY